MTLCIIVMVMIPSLSAKWYLLLEDPDSYTRLTRIWHFIQTGAWFDNHFPYYNTPWGIGLHWTKPLDFCLLFSASLLSPFMGFQEALYYGSFFWNPFFLFCASFSLAWGIYPLLGRTGALFTGLLVLAQPIALGYATPNRIDHHLMALFFQSLSLAICFRPIIQEKALAIVLALGFWTTIEFGLFAAIFLASVYWIFSETSFRRLLFWFAVSLSAALIVERGPYFLNSLDIQRLSLLHVLMAWSGWLTLKMLQYRPWHKAVKAIFAGCSLVSVFGALVYAFHIDLQIVDPRIKYILLDLINDIQPAFFQGHFNFFILPLLGISLVGVLSILFPHWMTRTQRWVCIPGLIIYTLLTLYQRRHGLFLLPYGVMTVGLLGGYILKKWESFPLKATALLGCLMGEPWVISNLLPLSDQKPMIRLSGFIMEPLMATLSEIIPDHSRLLIWPELDAAAIIWHLGVNKDLGSIYPPYHQNVEGILDAMTFYKTDDPKILQAILIKRGITHLMIARAEEPYEKKRKNREGQVFFTLFKGPPPSFLKEISLPKEVSLRYALFVYDNT